MVFTMDTAGGANKVSSLISGATVTMTPAALGGSIKWTCTSSLTGVADNRLPSVCR
jgi:hypothetical protein